MSAKKSDFPDLVDAIISGLEKRLEKRINNNKKARMKSDNLTYDMVKELYFRKIMDEKEMLEYYKKNIKGKIIDDAIYVDLFDKGIIGKNEVREYFKKKYEISFKWLENVEREKSFKWLENVKKVYAED